ncbi:MAG: FAD:protein FMN transferase [Firmicutes bacterium]|nr:FAD:protein FMN transferase [Bacillota bacterium]
MKNRSFLVVLCLILTVSGCKKSGRTKYTKEYFGYFDTYSYFSAYCEDKNKFDTCAAAIDERLSELNKDFDIYNEYSGVNNLCTVNKKAGIEPVKVSDDIIEIVSEGKKAYEETGGNVNIAFGAVLSVWHEYRERALEDSEKAEIPSLEELKKAEKHCSIDAIVVDKNASTLYIKEAGCSIDIGALAKGYAAEKAKDIMVSHGITCGMVSLGGNVVCLSDEEKPNWKIGVEDPFSSDSSQYIHAFEVESGSAVTSGNYQRYYEYKGKRYSHIIDKDTLFPAEENVSVTIKCQNSLKADIFSTALYILPYEEGVALAKEQGLEVFWVCNDGSIKKTENF